MINILMAAYNGEKYIGEQIESILKQTFLEWRLIIQDDSSTDRTFDIALDYAKRYPNQISAFKREKNSGSASNNFFSMLRYVDGQYVMFADDDDIWLPDKIAISMEKMKDLERNHGTDIPLLVHTDMEVVSDSLRRISGSFFNMQKLDSRRRGLNQLLVQNIVTGCTLMANARLIKMARVVPTQAVMHDWWFALIASAFGNIAFINRPTMLYRQHNDNAVGAKDARTVGYYINRLSDPRQAAGERKKTYRQASEFSAIFGTQLDGDAKQMLMDYASIGDKSLIRKFRILKKYQLWKNSIFRKIYQLI